MLNFNLLKGGFNKSYNQGSQGNQAQGKNWNNPGNSRNNSMGGDENPMMQAV